MKRLHTIFLGIRDGLLLGLVFTALAAFAFLLTGGGPIGRARNLTFFEVAGAYLGGGASGGAIVGALYPLVRFKAGALLVGILAAISFSVAVMGSLQGFSPWTGGHTFVVSVMSITLGLVAGSILHTE